MQAGHHSQGADERGVGAACLLERVADPLQIWLGVEQGQVWTYIKC